MTSSSCVATARVILGTPAVIIAQNCSQIPYTMGNTSDPFKCACQVGYVWISNACVRNCTSVDNSNGTNINNGQCYCNPGSNWKNNMCVQDCTGREYVVGNDNVTGNCMCLQSFSYVNNSCQLTCLKVLYGNHKVVPGKKLECECKSGYRWDPKIFNCVSSGEVNSLALGLGLGIPLGLLALAGLGYWLYTCRKPSPPIPVQQPTGMMRTEQNIGVPSTTSAMDTERALKPPQTYPTSSYQYGARTSRTSGANGMLPAPQIMPSSTSPHSNMQTSAVMAGPPPSGLLPNQSNMGVMTTTTQRTVIEPIAGQAYNISGAIANDVYNTANQGVQGAYNSVSQGAQGAYNTAQSGAQNMYGQARDGVSAAAANLGRRMSGS